MGQKMQLNLGNARLPQIWLRTYSYYGNITALDNAGLLISAAFAAIVMVYVFCSCTAIWARHWTRQMRKVNS